MFKEID